MKHILPYILFTLLFFSCTERANETVSQSKSITNNTEQNKEQEIPQVINDNTADELNTEGFSLYEKGDYSDAADIFEEALRKDPNHTYAGYNLACMLALQKGEGKIIDLNRMYSLLFLEIARTPSRIEKIKNDGDLDSIRQAQPFQYLISNYTIINALFEHLVQEDSSFEIDVDSHFNGEENGIILKFTDDEKVNIIPVSRINTLQLEDKSSEVIIFERYTTEKKNYPQLANTVKISPISTDFSDFTSSIDILLLRMTEILDSKSLYNGMNESFSADSFTPIKVVNSFGNHSFYLKYSFFYSSFMEFTLFFSIVKSKIIASSPIITESENLSDLDFGREYDFSTLSESNHNITIEETLFNNENNPVQNIPANSNKTTIIELLSWEEYNSSIAGGYSLNEKNIDHYLDMVLIEGGTMEIQGEQTQIDSFYMNKFETTKSLEDYVLSNINTPDSADMVSEEIQLTNKANNFPANFDWYSSIVFCNKLSMLLDLEPVYYSDSTFSIPVLDYTEEIYLKKSANGYRLPTEREWEYAARGEIFDEDYTYSGSNDLNVVAWNYNNTSKTGLQEVGQKIPNQLEIYDMSGNIAEWCWDLYEAPGFESEVENRVLRGGECASGYDIEIVQYETRERSHANIFFSEGTGLRLCRNR